MICFSFWICPLEVRGAAMKLTEDDAEAPNRAASAESWKWKASIQVMDKGSIEKDI